MLISIFIGRDKGKAASEAPMLGDYFSGFWWNK